MPMLDVDGSRLYYSVTGKGVPIVFIHPPLLTHENFTYQTRELSQFFQVITFDIRGHGRSQPSSKPLTYPLIAEDIKQLLHHLQIPHAYICGYSTGGSIALEFLLNDPEQSLGAIIISGMSEVKNDRLKAKIALGVALAKAKAISTLAVSVACTNANTFKLFRTMYRAARQGNAQNIEQYYRYSMEYNCTARLQEINLPILLVYGKNDPLFQPYAKLLHEKLPDSELVFIEKVSHRIPGKAAKVLHEQMRRFIHSHTPNNKQPLPPPHR